MNGESEPDPVLEVEILGSSFLNLKIFTFFEITEMEKRNYKRNKKKYTFDILNEKYSSVCILCVDTGRL